MDIENIDYGEKLEEGKQTLAALVQKVLDKDGIDYSIEDHEPSKSITYSCDKEDKHIDVEVRVWLGDITVKCIYPFPVPAEVRAIMSLFLSEINQEYKKPFTKLELSTGKIYVENSVITYGYVDQDEKVISGELLISIERAFSYYEDICNIIAGKLTKEQRDHYRKILFYALNDLDELEDEIYCEEEPNLGKSIEGELPFK